MQHVADEELDERLCLEARTTRIQGREAGMAGVGLCSLSPPTLAYPGGQAPAAHAQIPLESARPGSGTWHGDAVAARAGAEVPAADQAWIAGLQHRPLSAVARKFVLQNLLLA